MVSEGVRAFAGNKRFELLHRLGSGGMGVVYAAHDRERNTTVALKTLKSIEARSVARFKNEFRALADLQHPNLVRLGELFSDGEQWFFTMELLSGVDFLRHVRADVPDGAPGDEVRLRAALKQLVVGVASLHAAGKVHRDIKPSNIRVTDEGRVVLLDFGLVTDKSGIEQSDSSIMGTARYMAPEQTSSKPVGPEADWYAVGTVLYEALTGHTPFGGPELELLIEKLRYEPPPPCKVAREVPADLDALCIDLLRKDPKARPSGQQILTRLRIDEAETVTVSSVSHSPSAPSLQSSERERFVGRQHELEQLRQAFADCQRGGAVTVFIKGESGVGKSSLQRRFTDQLRAEHPHALVLAGRCFERESVPYKAFDGIMDLFADFLAAMPPVEAALLLSTDAAALVRLFPSLRRVPVVGRLRELWLNDAQELRRRAFAALRTMWRRLAERRPLVVCIDDFQWTDADSLTLLGELLHPPEAPPLLLLGTVQTGVAQDPVAAVADRLGDVRRLELGSLPIEDAEKLAQSLGAHAEAAAVAQEAGGHPLFIHVLLRHAAQSGARRELHLDDVLWERIAKLDEPPRRLLETLAVAGAPLSFKIASLAADLDGDELGQLVNVLRLAQLVRRTSAPGQSDDSLETYHYRVRQAVLLNLSPARFIAHHLRLANVLEATGVGVHDPVSLVWHLEAAGELGRAAMHAERAARQALESLAFARAAQLYDTALRLGKHDEAGARRLWLALGETLANAGRGKQAATALQTAAQGAGAKEALDLNRRAAEQLLIAGHVVEGIALLNVVLAQMGLELPSSSGRALASVVLRRAQLRLRGLGFRRRAESEIAPAELSRIDACWSVALGLAHIDFFRSAEFQVRHSQLALRAGEPMRVMRALCAETILSALGGGKSRARTAALMASAARLAKEVDTPYSAASIALLGQTVAMFEGRFRDGVAHSLEAEERLRSTAGVAFETDTLRVNSLFIWWHRGQIKELCARAAAYLRNAEERGAVLMVAAMSSGIACQSLLARDDSEGARHYAQRARELCSPDWPNARTYNDMVAEANTELYVDPRSPLAWQRVNREWSALRRTLFLRMQTVAIQMLELRGRAALGAALGASGEARARLLRAAHADARAIEREQMMWGAPLALLLRAGIARLRADSGQAAALLERAEAGFAAAHMDLHAEVARRRRGELLGGSQGDALIAAADQWMSAQTIKAPRKLVAMLTPAFEA
jgi:serine/threonine protein kinase